ncbi:MAG: hypothetical protein ACYC4L_04790 [Chloroflexota bacterium]
MGRQPRGGEVEVARLAIEEPASELASRMTRLETGDGLEDARLKRLLNILQEAESEVKAQIQYDQEVENPHHQAGGRLAYGILRAIASYRETLCRSRDDQLRGLVEGMLSQIERLANAATPEIRPAA